MATSDSSAPCRQDGRFPVDLRRAESHSWEYGHRCVRREGRHRETWADENGRQSIAVYDVTDHTVVLRVETPAGRQSFYGMADSDYRRARDCLRAADAWTSVDE